MSDLTIIDWLALVLAIVGALNWGLVGLFKFDLVKAIFGEDSAFSRVIFVLVGFSGVYLIFLSLLLARK